MHVSLQILLMLAELHDNVIEAQNFVKTREDIPPNRSSCNA